MPSRPAGPAWPATTSPAACKTFWTKPGARTTSSCRSAAAARAHADQPAQPGRSRSEPASRPTSSARRSSKPSRSMSGRCCARTAATWKSSTSRTCWSIAVCPAPAGLRRRQPDAAHVGRTDAQGDGRRAHPRDPGVKLFASGMETMARITMTHHLRRQQRHHGRRPGSPRGDGPLLHGQTTSTPARCTSRRGRRPTR